MLMLCPICSADFQLPEANCPACGCGLIPASLDAAPELETDNGLKLVELCRPRLYSLAMMIKQTLDRNGVPAMVLGGNAFSVMPHLAFSGEMRIMVSETDLGYARELYAAYFQNDGETDYDEE